MFDKKYLLMIGIILTLLITYYFYDQIRGIRNLFTPTYEKAMQLELRMKLLEQRQVEQSTALKSYSQQKSMSTRQQAGASQSHIDSIAYSCSYNSDMVKGTEPNSAHYTDLTDTEVRDLMKKIKSSQSQGQIQNQQSNSHLNKNKPLNPNLAIVSEIQDDRDIVSKTYADAGTYDNDVTINVKLNDLIKTNGATTKPKFKEVFDLDSIASSEAVDKHKMNEYQKMINTLKSDMAENINSDNSDDDDFTHNQIVLTPRSSKKNALSTVRF